MIYNYIRPIRCLKSIFYIKPTWEYREYINFDILKRMVYNEDIIQSLQTFISSLNKTVSVVNTKPHRKFRIVNEIKTLPLESAVAARLN